ncbi:GMC oxidoreductase [Jackrogersella minutella]|nr:GMC oxidoreductase [Jackrogersella minutella]
MSTSPISPIDFVTRNFDYLVVGGGTAGLAVAARLSEDPSLTVGVLEAGLEAPKEDSINTPDRALQTLGTKYDWQFETVPQAGLGGRTLAWPRGKVLGGTSALNLMTWNRGNKEDYDAWEKLGNKGWGWNGLQPFFRKSETFHLPDAESQTSNRQYFNTQDFGTGGPVHVSYSKSYSRIQKICYDSLANLGIPENKTHNAGSNVGVWTNLMSVNPENNTRSYASSAYYVPNSHRQNLFVLTEALAQEIIMSQESVGWTATGIRFTHGGNSFTVSASREIILSAGSVQSPQLLELSGIGDPQVLKDAGIEVKVTNPNVGENLQDHLMTISVYEVDPSVQKAEGRPPETPYCYLPILAVVSQDVFEQLTSKVKALEKSSPEKSEILRSRFDRTTSLGQFEYIFKPEPSRSEEYVNILQILQYPFSRGSIHVQKQPESERVNKEQSTIADNPRIDPGYYSGPHGEIDLEVMTECMQFSDRLCRSTPLSDVVYSRIAPPPSVDKGHDLRDWVIQNTTTDWHPIGTCGMGGRGVHSGVVDDRLRVYGVARLRVIDASIMPLQISAHLQATVYAIAEKGAHMIRQDNLERRI